MIPKVDTFYFFGSMIHHKIQMFSFTELVELLVWVGKEVLLFFYCQRCSSHICIHLIIITCLISYHTVLCYFIYFFLLFMVASIYDILVAPMQEEAYVEFLRIRRVPLLERKCTDDAPNVVPQVSLVFKVVN